MAFVRRNQSQSGLLLRLNKDRQRQRLSHLHAFPSSTVPIGCFACIKHESNAMHFRACTYLEERLSRPLEQTMKLLKPSVFFKLNFKPFASKSRKPFVTVISLGSVCSKIFFPHYSAQRHRVSVHWKTFVKAYQFSSAAFNSTLSAQSICSKLMTGSGKLSMRPQ